MLPDVCKTISVRKKKTKKVWINWITVIKKRESYGGPITGKLFIVGKWVFEVFFFLGRGSEHTRRFIWRAAAVKDSKLRGTRAGTRFVGCSSKVERCDESWEQYFGSHHRKGLAKKTKKTRAFFCFTLSFALFLRLVKNVDFC